MNGIIRFFDLYARDRSVHAQAQGASEDRTSLGRQLAVYGFCVLGVIVGPFLVAAAQGVYPPFAAVFLTPRTLWAFLIALVLVAMLFKTVLGASNPLVVQLGSALAAGAVSGTLLPMLLEKFVPVA